MAKKFPREEHGRVVVKFFWLTSIILSIVLTLLLNVILHFFIH